MNFNIYSSVEKKYMRHQRNAALWKAMQPNPNGAIQKKTTQESILKFPLQTKRTLIKSQKLEIKKKEVSVKTRSRVHIVEQFT